MGSSQSSVCEWKDLGKMPTFLGRGVGPGIPCETQRFNKSGCQDGECKQECIKFAGEQKGPNTFELSTDPEDNGVAYCTVTTKVDFGLYKSDDTEAWGQCSP